MTANVFQNNLAYRLNADVVTGTFLAAVSAVFITAVPACRLPMIARATPCRRKYQTGMAFSADKQATEDIDGTGPVGGLLNLDTLLHSIKRGLIHQRLMGILHSHPFFLRPCDMPFVFERTRGDPLADQFPQVNGIAEDMLYCHFRP